MYLVVLNLLVNRDVSAGATEVTPKFSDTLTLSPPGGADSAKDFLIDGRRGMIGGVRLGD